MNAPDGGRSGLRLPLLLVLLLTCSLLPGVVSARTDWPVVVPAFRNETGEPGWDWLSYGYPEAMRTKLHGTTRMRALTWEEIAHAISQDPSLAGDMPAVSRRLGSDLLVLGSFQKSGETLEVTAVCIDPVSGRKLATFRSLGPDHDPAVALNDIILQIAEALHIALAPEESKAVQRPVTGIVDAFREHGRGLMALNRETAAADAIEEAERHFREATSLDPDYADPHYRLATLLQHRGNVEDAEKHYREALRADVDHRDARYRLGLLLVDLDRKSEAMAELEHALKQAPEDPAVQTALSSIWFDQYQTNFEQMEKELKQAVAENPENAELRVELGGVYEELSRVQDAAAQYRKALELDPKNGNAAYKLGMVQKSLGNISSAIDLLGQAVRNGTDHKRVHYYLGDLLMRQKKYGKAAEAFIDAVEAEPNHVQAYYDLGRAHAAAGHHQDALLAYGKYARINQDDARPQLEIGRAYVAMGLPKQAMAAFKKSVQIDPGFADGHIAIGELYEKESLTFRAARAFKDAIRVQPDHPRAEELKALIRKYQPPDAGAADR